MATNAVIAILLSDPRRAAPLAERLQQAGHRPLLAETSDELYRLAAREPVDLLVVQHRLEGFLTGLEVIGRLTEEMMELNAVLVAEPSASLRERAVGAGVLEVLEENLPLDTFAGVILALVARCEQAAFRIHPRARRLVNAADCIRPLPQVLIKLAESLRGGHYQVEELAADISRDPRITADVLRLANSAAVGRVHRTTSLPAAIRFLGVRQTVTRILSDGFVDAQRGLVQDVPQDLRAWFAYRSVLTASTANAFARNFEAVLPDAAYVCGLLQDVGTLVLARGYGERYRELLARVRKIAHLRLENEEHSSYGVSHADVSAALAEKWGLPAPLVQLIGRHHERHDGPGRPAPEAAYLRVLQIGETVADIADRGTAQRFVRLNQLLAHYGRERVADCRQSIREAVERMKDSALNFQVTLPDDQALARLTEELSHYNEYEEVPEEGAEVSAGPREESAPAAVPTARPTILVLDDEAPVARVVALFLKNEPVEVLHAATSAEAERELKRASLLLCDVHLGAEDGIDVVRRLRRRGYRGPVIMISGDNYRDTVQRSIEAGVCGYLIKPLQKSLLIEKIRGIGVIPASATPSAGALQPLPTG